MADRKNPLFLRVMIVVVALLLGFSLNMFQFRNPFRSMDTDSASNTQFPDKSRFPSRQETALPVSPVAKPPQPDAAPVKEVRPAQAQTAAKPEPKKDAADVAATADVPAQVPTPQAVADAAPEKPGKPEKQDSPVSITVEHESPSLAPPKVTSDAGKAKAGKIGRQVATGVAESKPEAKTVAEASAPAPAAPVVAVREEKAVSAPSAGTNEQSDSGKAAPQENAQAKPEPEKTGTSKPAQQADQGAQSAPPASEPANTATAAAPPEPGVAVAQAPQGITGDKAPTQASQTSTPGQDGPATVQTPQPAQRGADAVPGKPSTAQASKPAQSDQQATKTPQPLAGVSPATSSSATTPSEKAQTDEKTATARGTKILEIKTQDKPGEFVLTIVTDGPVEKVTSFHAKGPARLAIDLQGSWQSAQGASIPVEGELFERVRLGAHPDKLRLVIDYRDKELSAFSEQIVEKQPKGVVVRIPKAKTKP